ncbi:MAG: NUDIX domain-containing protein [Bacillota bacterium]
MEERFDIYDSQGRYLNKSVPRGTRLPEGEYFMVVHVWIEREDGKFLIQKRAKKSDPIPHQWAVTSGLTSEGEGPKESAIREVKEEIGVELKASDLTDRAQIISTGNRYHTITHVYHTYQSLDVDALELDKDEVLEVAYVSLKTILEMVEKGTFWDYNKLLGTHDYFSLLKRGTQ